MGDRAREREPFLASGVPNLGLDDLIVNADAAGSEFNSDGGLGLEAEFVPGEARQEVGLANARVPYQHHLEQIVVVVLRSVRRHCFLSSLFLYSFSGRIIGSICEAPLNHESEGEGERESGNQICEEVGSFFRWAWICEVDL
jgi:hypothetical protein